MLNFIAVVAKVCRFWLKSNDGYPANRPILNSSSDDFMGAFLLVSFFFFQVCGTVWGSWPVSTEDVDVSWRGTDKKRYRNVFECKDDSKHAVLYSLHTRVTCCSLQKAVASRLGSILRSRVPQGGPWALQRRSVGPSCLRMFRPRLYRCATPWASGSPSDIPVVKAIYGRKFGSRRQDGLSFAFFTRNEPDPQFPSVPPCTPMS